MTLHALGLLQSVLIFGLVQTDQALGELTSVYEMAEDDWKKFAWRFRRVTFEPR
jgi:hypothetical protein